MAHIARKFTEFAAHCEGFAPLYALLAPKIAGDPVLLKLAAHAQPGQPPPNMLFAAVHYLLLAEPEQALARYYATVGGQAAPDDKAFAQFRAFCLEHYDTLAKVIQTHFTQTNEVQRSVYLLPGLALVQQQAGGQPLALLELGPSAGLNLNLDRYGYCYSNGQVCGDPASPVQLFGELQGEYTPQIPPQPPQIVYRLGIERNPIDLAQVEARRWLEALVWPEHVGRLARLRAAMAIAQVAPPPIVHGDLLVELVPQIALAPPDAAICVTHTHVLYQLEPAMRLTVESLLIQVSHQRTVYRLGCEHDGAQFPQLILDVYQSGVRQTHLLAHTTGHANWIAWQLERNALTP